MWMCTNSVSMQVIALLYPRSEALPEGLVETLKLRLPGAPKVETYVLDLITLAMGRALPAGLRP
jgi:hypothetical protein